MLTRRTPVCARHGPKPTKCACKWHAKAASAWLTLQTATAQIGAAQAGLAAAQESYDLATLRYNAGKSLTAERLDALAALIRARGTLDESKAGLLTARAGLSSALGVR